VTRTRIMVITAALALSACGSSGEDTEPSEPGTASSVVPAGSEAAAEPDPEASAAPDDLGFGDEDATAVVVIGDERFEFTDLYCVTMGGALGAMTISADPSVDISLPPAGWETSGEDWDPPSVRVSGDEPYIDWHAGGETVELMSNIGPGVSQVDTYETDGFHATGSAMFVSLTEHSDAPEGIPGTFEVTCPRP
jgi:hypothetical protein